jgi:hypothetical protein
LILKFQDLLDIYAEHRVVKEFAALIFKGQGVAAATQYSHLDDLNPQALFLFATLFSGER